MRRARRLTAAAVLAAAAWVEHRRTVRTAASVLMVAEEVDTGRRVLAQIAGAGANLERRVGDLEEVSASAYRTHHPPPGTAVARVVDRVNHRQGGPE